MLTSNLPVYKQSGLILMLSLLLMLSFGLMLNVYRLANDYQWLKQVSQQDLHHQLTQAKNLLIGYLCTHTSSIEEINATAPFASTTLLYHYLPFPDRHTDILGYDQTGDIPNSLSFNFTANSTLGSFPYIATGIHATAEPLGLMRGNNQPIWMAIAPKYLQHWSYQATVTTGSANQPYNQLLSIKEGNNTIDDIAFLLILPNEPINSTQTRKQFSAPQQFLESITLHSNNYANYDPSDFIYVSHPSLATFNDQIYWIREKDLPTSCTNPIP